MCRLYGWLALVLVSSVALVACERTRSAERSDPKAKETDSHRDWGSIDVSKVKSKLKAVESVGSSCLQDADEAGKDPWGHLVVSFEISEEGELASVDFSENSAGETAARCMEQMLERIPSYPEPTGGPVLFRRFHAYSPDGEFDTDRDASSFVSDADGAIVLEPLWVIPFETKPKSRTTSTTEEEQSPEKNPTYETNSPADIAGPGDLDPRAVDQILGLAGGMIQQCYVDFLENHPGAEGEVELEFVLHEDGSISDFRATTNSVGGDMGKCVERAVREMSFMPPEGGHVEVTKAFQFALK